MNIWILILLFFTYAFIGWIIEVVGKIIEKHHFINRGFLVGPICPIYGYGCILLILLLNRYRNDLFLLFIMAIVICSILEYFTSYFMEKLFNTRWWDYSSTRFNLNGRICADTMIPFGIMGTLVVKFINPYLLTIYNKIPSNIIIIITCLFITLYIIDNIISFNVIFRIKNTITNFEKDATEEITKKVKERLTNNILYRRLFNAFPKLLAHRDYLYEVRKNLEKDIKKINDNIKKLGSLENVKSKKQK
jgi:uncharacterized membrane protein